MAITINEVYSVLTQSLDSSPTVSIVDNNTISIVNEAFNYMQTDTIRKICEVYNMVMIITYNGKRPHDAIELTIVNRGILGCKHQSNQSSNGLMI